MAAKQIRDAANGTLAAQGTAGLGTILLYTTTSGETGDVFIRLAGRDTSGRRCAAMFQVGYENIAGTLTIGTQTQIALDQNAAFGLQVSFTVSGAVFQFNCNNKNAVSDFYAEAEILRS